MSFIDSDLNISGNRATNTASKDNISNIEQYVNKNTGEAYNYEKELNIIKHFGNNSKAGIHENGKGFGSDIYSNNYVEAVRSSKFPDHVISQMSKEQLLDYLYSDKNYGRVQYVDFAIDDDELIELSKQLTKEEIIRYLFEPTNSHHFLNENNEYEYEDFLAPRDVETYVFDEIKEIVNNIQTNGEYVQENAHNVLTSENDNDGLNLQERGTDGEFRRI